MTNQKEQLILVPIEILRVIPLYNGDKNKLNLFLRKCEYVIDMYKGNEAQNLYLLHTVSSRLVENAADLLSEREDIETWSQLKEVLIENYSDPRSEDSIAIEFESLKIKPYQSLLKFYNLLQSTHKTLIAKIETQDESIKSKKETLYNKMALNVFMHNLPEYLVQMLRLKSPTSLEEAYNIVMEEISFFKQYSKKQYTTALNTVPEFKCFYPFGVVHPFPQQQPVGPKFGFGSPASQIQSTNYNQKSYGPSLFGSAQSQQGGLYVASTSSGFGTTALTFGNKPPVTSGQNSINSSKPSDNIVKNMKSDNHAFHNDEDE